MCDADNSDEDYNFDDDDHHNQISIEKKYPLHDCCEFDDIETLKNLIYLDSDSESDEDEEEDDHKSNCGTNPERDDSSSSDENDSTAAAHAAAVGHSPQPLKHAVGSLTIVPTTAPILGNSIEMINPSTGSESIVVINGDAKPKESKETTDLPPVGESQFNEIVDKVDCTSERTLTEKMDKPTDDGGNVNDPENAGVEAMQVDRVKDESVNSETPIEKTTVNDDLPAEEANGDKSIKDKVDDVPQRPAKTKRRRVDPDVHLNERDDDENTSLHVAIHARKLGHVKILLEAGASFRFKCDGSLPVHTAISLGAIKPNRQFAYDCLVMLHEHGADLTAKDEAVHTPLYLSCMFNLPQITSYILSDNEGLSTLNTRADRAGNRPLHAAAKFDTLDNPSLGKPSAASATSHLRVFHHHPDGTTINDARLPASSLRGKLENMPQRPDTATATGLPSTEALLTQVILGSPGVEVDAINFVGQTPLHVACLRGNWPVVRLLLQADADTKLTDRRGYTPGQLAYKRGMLVPNDLVEALGDPSEKGIIPPLRDLIVDPNGATLLLSHELCVLHRTCPPIRRDSPEPPPENVRRLNVLLDKETGIFRAGEFSSLTWCGESRRAAIADVLKVHEYAYVEKVSQMTAAIPDHPNAIAHLDADTAVSRWSFEAALRAAGALCQAVDRVVAGECRNAFCAVRPPGHHAGPRGIVRCANDVDGGSHGFCLLNNVAIGAAYARSMYRNDGIRKVAIVDFDVHHGNGTEAIIRNLAPSVEKGTIHTPFAFGELSTTCYRPWLDETDIKNVFFASTHGYGNRGYDQPGWFYPASGKTHTSEAIANPGMVENPNLGDFILSQTWTRMGEESVMNCCKIINVGLGLPEPDADPHARSMKQRLELRDAYRKNILPNLRDFDPDIIFISAGFDAHRRDTMNFGYVGMVEDDYEWITEQLIKIANTCCNGRVVSVLEGGYKMHGGIVSPFARSAASHLRALVDGGRSRELYDPQDCLAESQFEKNMYDRRERKREQDREHLRQLEEAHSNGGRNGRRNILEAWSTDSGAPEDPDAPCETGVATTRKRRRNQVNYKELFKQMQQEGFAG